MAINQLKTLLSGGARDDQPLPVIRRDLSGGVNTRQDGNSIGEKQAVVLYNIDLGVAGKTSKRLGSVLIGNDVGSSTPVKLHDFVIQGETDWLLMFENTTLHKWTGSGNWSSLKTDFSASTDVGMCSAKQNYLDPDDVFIFQNDVDNPHLIDSDGNITDLGSEEYYSMPKSTVMAWYNNRFWIMADGKLYYSDAYPDSYIPDSAKITGDKFIYVRAAIITGNSDSFTGTAGDTLRITIDDEVYNDISISSATSIADVVTAINTAVGSTVASTDSDGYLVITSPTSGAGSRVRIADGSGSTQTVVGKLSATRKATGSGQTKAIIVGDCDSFTGEAGDTIKVTVDDDTYDNIDISAAASIANVVTAINTAVGSTVASANSDGFLQLTSPTYGSGSKVSIANGTDTGQSVVAELFTVYSDRSDTGENSYTIKVTIDEDSDGDEDEIWDDIDISECEDIDDIVTAINTAVGVTVAYKGVVRANPPSKSLIGVVSNSSSDTSQTVTINGTVDGSADSETVTLTGETVAYTIKYFTAVSSITKSAATTGDITVTSNAESFTIAVLDKDMSGTSGNNGYLQIASTKKGLNSNVSITKGSGSGDSPVDKLFDVQPTSDTGYDPFDTESRVFSVPVGDERVLLPSRDSGLVCLGSECVYSLKPSSTPAATDQPEFLLDIGCVSKKGAVIYGDDIYFFSQDGLRALKRTVQDKLQLGANFPISYRLKDEYERIDWDYIERLSMVAFDNKIFIAVPTSSTEYDTWVYYPALDAFMIIQGWSPSCWATYKINNEERLYYGKQGDGVVYRAWYGYSDEGTTTTNGTAINYQEEGRKEDCGQPLVKKSGGIVRIKALSSGNYDLSVYVSIDDQAYVTMGTINLTGNAPTLPTALPFTLASANVIVDEFHLDSLGEWNQIQIKIVHNALNGSDDITVLSREIVTYANAFQEEG